MYQMHVQIMGIMADAATSYAHAVSTFWDIQAKTWADLAPATATRPAAASEVDNPFSLPEIPRNPGSWYRRPYDNPLLGYWDQMLRSWHTTTPSGPFYWPGPLGIVNPADGVSGPWAAMNVWPSVLAAAALSQWWAPTAHWSTSPTNWLANGRDANLILAKVVFPDKTEVTFTFPALPPAVINTKA